MRRRILVILTAVLLTGLIPAMNSPARAADINVACNTADLITAINTANGNGQADTLNLASGCTYSFSAGDVTNPDSALPRITSEMTINGNGATLQRAGGSPDFRLLYVGSGGNLTVNAVTVSGGSQPSNFGGGIYNDTGTLTVINSGISSSSALYGGGIDSFFGTLTVTNSTVSGNTATYGAGIDNFGGTLTVTNSTLSGNAATFGGGIYNTSTATVTNSTLSGNSAASSGGGIFSTSDGTLTLTGSTLSGNSASISGGGIFNDGALTVTNSIVWGNSSQIAGSGSSTVTYSLIQGGYTGTGNLNVDPLFVGPIAPISAPTILGNYHLLPNSPAIDAGSNAAVVGANDIDGDPRIVGGRVDMGSDEVNYCLTYTFPYTVPAGDTLALTRAINCANDNPDANVINLTNSTYTFTIAVDIDGSAGDSALPRVTTPITINGSGATLERASGSPDFRLLLVAGGGNLTLDNVTVSSGSAPALFGGGILNSGTLTVANSTISDNNAFNGGGIFNDTGGTLTVTNSTISGNSAINGGGGIDNFGGTLTVTNSTISGNTATYGGGLYNSLFSTLTVTNSTLSGNTATYGGGLHNSLFSTLTVANSTLSGNSAGTSGGGILNDGNTLTVTNSIVWGNSGTQIAGPGASTVTFSLIQGGYAGTGNLNVDPLFVAPEPFTNAPTTAGDYHLQLSSPAIDAGSNAAVVGANDIDGDPRIVGGRVDMGSDEVNYCLTYTFPYTVPAGNTLALTRAINCANDNPDANVINLTNSIYSFTTAVDIDGSEGDSALPRVTTPITINGSGATLERANGSPDFRLLRVASGGDLTLNTVTVSGGLLNAFYSNGGGIYNSAGTLTVTNSIISSNSAGGAGNGGGLFNTSSGTVTLTNSTISGNSAGSEGGGLYTNSDTVTLTNSTVSGNSAFNGGGILSAGTLTVTNSTVSGNSAINTGGGLNNEVGGMLTVINSTLAGNNATNSGGGIANFGTLAVTNSTLSGNNATNSGGGIYNKIGTVAVTNSTLSGNSAGTSGGGILNDGSTLTVTNSIVWGNSGTQIAGPGASTVTFSLIQGGFTGTGNLDIDPLFVGPIAPISAPTILGNYHLQLASPAIDAGNNTAVVGTTDIDGDPRIVGGRVDMGSDEVNYCLDFTSPTTVPAGNTLALTRAINCANANPDANVINLTNGTYSFTTAVDIDGSEGDSALPRVTTPITINGSGAILERANGSPDFRLLRVASGGNLTLNAVTVSGGSQPSKLGGGIFNDTGTLTVTNSTISNSSAVIGGGIGNGSSSTLTVTNSTVSSNSAFFGGGIFNASSSTLTVTNSTISDNSADYGGGIYNNIGSQTVTNSAISDNSATFGGGLFNKSGSLTVTNSTLSGNSANSTGGGIYNDIGTLTVTSSTISGNSALVGGGLSVDSTVTLTDSTLSGNSASLSGGGIDNRVSSTLTVTDSTITGNSAGGFGGGILNSGTLTVANSTLSDNSATYGGGIDSSAGTTTLINSTVSGNSATFGGGLYNIAVLTAINSTLSGNSASSSGGGIFNNAGVLTVTNSIVWGNETQITGSASATVTYSLIAGGFAGTGNLNVDPLFVSPQPFANAPTSAGDYHLQPNSPAIDAGNNAATIGATDIDGDPRIVGGRVDMGSDEVDYCLAYTSPATIPAGNTVGLIRAINCANANPDANVINLTAGTYSFTTASDIDVDFGDSALPRVTSPITINGNGATLARAGGSPSFRLLYVAGGDLTLDNVTVSGGSTSGNGGGIYNGSTLTVTNSTISGNSSTTDGGGIYNYPFSTLTVSNSSVSGNSATNGGGIYNASGSTSTFTSSAISSNSATNGGGIYNGSGSTSTFTSSTISGNSAGNSGGGIFNSDTLTVTNSAISDNSADNGGGIYNLGTLTVTSSTFSGNSTNSDGGGIYNSAGTLTVTNSTLSGNSAFFGGGIHIATGTLTVTSSTLSGNSAAAVGGLYNSGGSLTVTNSILWGNGTQIGGDASVTYSLVEGGFTGTGNLNVDPMFVNAGGGDYHLQASSPAIDAGNNAALPADTLDLDGDLNTTEPIPFDRDGNTRVIGGIVDMGAYEIQSVNLIVNGSFEAGIAPWGVTTLGRDKIKAKNPYDGLFAFRFTGFAGKPAAKLKQTILTPPVADGDTVTAAAYIRSGLAANGKMTVKIKTDLGAVFKGKVAFAKSGGYALHQIDVPVTLGVGETVANIKLQFKDTSQSGKVYIDAVSVMLNSPSAPRTVTRAPVLPPPAAPSGFRGGN